MNASAKGAGNTPEEPDPQASGASEAAHGRGSERLPGPPGSKAGEEEDAGPEPSPGSPVGEQPATGAPGADTEDHALDGRTLMLAVAADEVGAFDRLVGAYETRVKATVSRYVGNRSWVDDLAQEVFLRLFRARARYAPSARFETFLHRVIFNACVNHTQYMNRRRALSLDAPRGGDGDDGGAVLPEDGNARPPLVDVEQAERAVFVRAAIEKLPDNQRRALMMSRFEGLGYEEIGEVMDLSLQAVKSLLWRARDSLRRHLSPILGDDNEQQT